MHGPKDQSSPHSRHDRHPRSLAGDRERRRARGVGPFHGPLERHAKIDVRQTHATGARQSGALAHGQRQRRQASTVIVTIRYASFTTDIIACNHTTALYFVPRLLPSPVVTRHPSRRVKASDRMRARPSSIGDSDSHIARVDPVDDRRRTRRRRPRRRIGASRVVARPSSRARVVIVDEEAR